MDSPRDYLLPPRPPELVLTTSELREILTHQVEIVEYQPDENEDLDRITFRGGHRYRLDFARLVSPNFGQDLAAIRAYDYDIREIFLDAATPPPRSTMGSAGRPMSFPPSIASARFRH